MALSRDLVYATKAVSDLHRNQTVHVAELEGSQTRVGFSVTVANQARQPSAVQPPKAVHHSGALILTLRARGRH
jgi:hypothetical protein